MEVLAKASSGRVVNGEIVVRKEEDEEEQEGGKEPEE